MNYTTARAAGKRGTRTIIIEREGGRREAKHNDTTNLIRETQSVRPTPSNSSHTGNSRLSRVCRTGEETKVERREAKKAHGFRSCATSSPRGGGGR